MITEYSDVYRILGNQKVGGTHINFEIQLQNLEVIDSHHLGGI